MFEKVECVCVSRSHGIHSGLHTHTHTQTGIYTLPIQVLCGNKLRNSLLLFSPPIHFLFFLLPNDPPKKVYKKTKKEEEEKQANVYKDVHYRGNINGCSVGKKR